MTASPIREFRDTMHFVAEPSAIQEDASSGKFRVRGRFQKCDTKNGNGRIYERKVWERVLADPELAEKLKSRGMLGELEHPADGVTNLSRVSHVITAIEMAQDGDIIGEAEVFDTPSGQILKELFRQGCRVGISSRGKGTSKMKNGVEYVNDDFVLDTFDFVENPSTPGAHPKPVSESRNDLGNNTTEVVVDPKELVARITGRIRDIRSLTESGKVSRSDIERYEQEILQLQMDLSTNMQESAALRVPGEDLVEDLRKLRRELNEWGKPPRMPKHRQDKKAGGKKQQPAGKGKGKKLKDEAAMYDDDDADDMDMDGDMDLDNDPGQEPIDPGNGTDDLDIDADDDAAPGLDGPDAGDDVEIDDFLKGIDDLSKEAITKRLKSALTLGEGLLRRNKALAKSNRTLRERYEHAVAATTKMVEQKNALRVREYVAECLLRNPELGRHKAKLLRESNIDAVDKQIVDLRKQKASSMKESKERKPPTKSKPNKSELPFNGVGDGSKQVKEAINGSASTNNKDEGIALAEKILNHSKFK